MQNMSLILLDCLNLDHIEHFEMGGTTLTVAEGEKVGNWLGVSYGDCVVHLMSSTLVMVSPFKG